MYILYACIYWYTYRLTKLFKLYFSLFIHLLIFYVHFIDYSMLSSYSFLFNDLHSTTFRCLLHNLPILDLLGLEVLKTNPTRRLTSPKGKFPRLTTEVAATVAPIRPLTPFTVLREKKKKCCPNFPFGSFLSLIFDVRLINGLRFLWDFHVTWSKR